MKNVFIISLLFFTACNTAPNSNVSKILVDTSYNIKNDPIFKFDTTGKTQIERLNKLIELSCLKRFDQSRTELIESTDEKIYSVSPIIKKGGNYSYELLNEQYNLGIKYNCIPKQGEYTMDVIGEDSLVDLYYQKIKLLTNWDNCNKIDGNESCNALKKIEPYPVKTYFKFDYIKMKNGMMHLSFFRKQLPELDAISK